MSAACAPATAISPAVVPRRRLFTIFISTSICCRGRDWSPRALLTLEGPLSSPHHPLFPLPSLSPRHRNDRKGRPWDAPLRRTPTLTHMFRQATTKRHFEHSEMQFSAGCCLNNTSLKAAIGRALTLLRAPR